MTKDFVNISNSTRPGSDGTYNKVIEQIQKDGVCPFCTDHLKQYHKNPILKESDRWILTTNMYPYANSKHHFLIILRTHKSDTKELSPEEWQDLHEQINWLVDSYNLPGGTLMMRCGDTSHTGATVTHLHAHFVAPDYDNPDRQPIMVRIG
jgi:diadenosine tetraphosphate (Ap4A) HIT family hydrolase